MSGGWRSFAPVYVDAKIKGESARARDIINIEAKVAEPNRKCSGQTREEKLERIKHELRDILYHVFGISHSYGIDVEEAFRTAMLSIEQRYPA